MSFAYFVAEDYENSALWAQRAMHERPNFMAAVRIHAASLAMSGRIGAARATMARVRGLDPTFLVQHVRGVTPLRRPEDLARYEDALRKAGLPD